MVNMLTGKFGLSKSKALPEFTGNKDSVMMTGASHKPSTNF